MTTTTINQFPRDVQEDIKETLKYCSGVYVFRENGNFRTSVGIALTGEKNPDDYKSWHIRSEDIYTDSERDAHHKSMPDMSW
jgi:hypothetical protein